MAVKYYCPKCGRRFVDWGAEKLEYKCPSETCEGEPLILPGSEPDEGHDAPHKEKRAKKRKAIIPSITSDIDVPDIDDEFAEDMDVDEDDDIEDEVDDDIVPIVVDEADAEKDDDLVADVDDAADVDDDDTFSEALGIDDEDVELEEE